MAAASPARAPARAPEPLCSSSVSVVICAYTERRWDALAEAVTSVAAQTPAPLQTIVVIDHNPALLARACACLARIERVTVIANTGVRGLSGARNSGVACAHGEIVAFLDDDARAEPGWLASLVAPFSNANVIGAGGVARPEWEAAAPQWIPEEFLWVVGCSYRGLPAMFAPIRNPIGANMAFRRDVLERTGGFADGIGRIGRTPLGCEETELSIRARELTGGTIVHVPHCTVRHRVSAERTSWSYYRRRCWSEGLSKALVRARVGAGAALASEREYVFRTLPSAFFNELRASLGGNFLGAVRACAIVVGVAITAAGYLSGCMRMRWRKR